MTEVDEEPVIVEEEEPEEENEDEIFAAGAGVGGPAATEIKLFGKWSFDDIEIRDISLVVRAGLG
jgi:small subunit ribosomal protein S5e